jgi:hypothetical protein
MFGIRAYTKGHGLATIVFGTAPLAGSTLGAIIVTGSASFTVSGGQEGGGNWQQPNAANGGDNGENVSAFYCIAAGGATTLTCSVTIVEGIVFEIGTTGLTFVASIINDQPGAVALNTGVLKTPPTFGTGCAFALNVYSGGTVPAYNASAFVNVDQDSNNEVAQFFFAGDVRGPNQALQMTTSNAPTGQSSRILLFKATDLTTDPRHRGLAPQQRRVA